MNVREGYVERELEMTPYLEMLKADFEKYGVKWVVGDTMFPGTPLPESRFFCNLVMEETADIIQNELNSNFRRPFPEQQDRPASLRCIMRDYCSSIHPESSEYYLMYWDGKFFTYEEVI